jgi:hypothetical protein
MACYSLCNRVASAVLRERPLYKGVTCSFRRFASNYNSRFNGLGSSGLVFGSTVLVSLGTAAVCIGLSQRNVAAEHQMVDDLPETAAANEQHRESQWLNRQNLSLREAVQATDELLQRIKVY